MQSNSERRNFFDRLIFNIEKKHLKAFTAYNKFTKERLHILKSNAPDSAWLEQIEKKIAVCAYEIIEYRQAAISKINTNLSLISLPFNSCIIELNYEDTLKITSDIKVNLPLIMKILYLKIEQLIKKQIELFIGPNKVEVKMWKLDDRSIEAKYCSTGEQKSILISIILSVAQIIKNSDFAKPPIILIDEAMAHLDQHHREALVDELSKLNTQSWYTGVSKEIFDHLSQDTIFFEVKNS